MGAGEPSTPLWVPPPGHAAPVTRDNGTVTDWSLTPSCQVAKETELQSQAWLHGTPWPCSPRPTTFVHLQPSSQIHTCCLGPSAPLVSAAATCSIEHQARLPRGQLHPPQEAPTFHPASPGPGRPWAPCSHVTTWRLVTGLPRFAWPPASGHALCSQTAVFSHRPDQLSHLVHPRTHGALPARPSPPSLAVLTLQPPGFASGP